MTRTPPGFRLSAATGTHRGDRQYQQDQVEVIRHPHNSACLLAVVADGMGGKSGGRKAADQVLLTSQQLFERYVPGEESAEDLLKQILSEAHLMIKLTALSAEEEPHSTLAAFMIGADRRCHWIHAGDSRIYLFRGPNLVKRTLDHSFVQRLVDEGQITESEAAVHPQSNLLTGCLGTVQDPVGSSDCIEAIEEGDTLICCSDGLWHYFTPSELGTVLHSLPPREAAELLISKARQRARSGGDNLSLAIVKMEALT
ncbi:PP2C family protein-serine/threonine phosphatase [Roseateles oligotrophus]|uniref:Protein phosphatase 2C domain-containing protein n=1 Tax=Roseateles oligotrophus TaxID=1769250 RepID=A0ABT2Y9N5_9BURK|nr:protein phosphatase 2C domain-containing protein [Roseateles oligotrophus]MCV2366765.1 protein phosphatase 2C domain-containing protein [Roseateles oligotrophus]